jgi:membrane protease YdiL (CAAX protease family)
MANGTTQYSRGRSGKWSTYFLTAPYVLGTLEREHGKVAAVAVSSVFFGLVHLLNPNASLSGFVGVSLAGVYFGAAFRVAGRLYLPIAAHLAWNLPLGPVLGLPVSGVVPPSRLCTEVAGREAVTGGAFGPEGGLLLWAALAANAPLLLWAGRKVGARTRGPAGGPSCGS